MLSFVVVVFSFWLHRVLTAACRLSLVAESRLIVVTSLVAEQGL